MLFGANAMKLIGEFFRGYRVSVGLDLEQVSSHLAPGQPDLIASYEAGETKIPAHHVFTLSNLYSIPPDELVCLLYDLALEQYQGGHARKSAQG